MAGFGRSNSLSINTGGSLFGSSTTSSQAPSAGGLFGNAPITSQSQPPPFGSTAASQPQQQTNTFGSSAQAGGLFAPKENASSGGGLFGASTAQPQQQPSLFGSLGQSQQQQTQQQPAQTSLFPSLGQQQQSQQQQQQQPSQGGLLRGLGQSQSQQSAPQMFAQPQPQTQPGQQGGTFGLSINSHAANASLFGNQTPLPPLGLGQSTQSQQTVPGVRIDVSQLRGTTRFTDLHDELQKDICLIDDFIQKQMSYRDQIDAVIPKTEEAVTSIAPDADLLNGKADTVELALDNDVQSIKNLRELVKADVDDAKLSFRSIENLKLPSQFHYQTGWQPTTAVVTLDEDATGPVDMIQYFSEQADSLDAQLQRYLLQVAEIEGHLRTVEASTLVQTEALVSRRKGANGEDGLQGKIKNLANTMGLFEEAIRNVASHVGSAREEVVELSSGGSTVSAGGANSNGSTNAWQRSIPAPPEPQRSRLGWS